MATAERVSRLEGTVQEQSHTIAAIHDSMNRIEQRFASIDQRFTHLEQRYDARFDALEAKMNWLMGVQLTSLVAIAVALIARS